MIELYTDGATDKDGLSGAGIYIKNGNEQMSFSVPLGNMTNHEAEFWAVIKALELCKEKSMDTILSIRTDSQIVAHAVDNRYCKNIKFQPLLNHILKLQENFDFVFIKWIPEKQNKVADQLAKKALFDQK